MLEPEIDPSDGPSEATAVAAIQNISDAFDVLCQERHDAGVEEYGPFTFLENDVIRMMMEELADTANYCRMQFIKLMLLQEQLEDMLNEKLDGEKFVSRNGDIQMGWTPKKGTKNIGWGDRG